MSPLIQWQEPQSVRDFEWAKAQATIKRVQRTGAITTLICGVPILGLCIGAPDKLPLVVFGLLYALALPTLIMSPLRNAKNRKRCELGSEGLRKLNDLPTSSGHLTTRIKWEDVRGYELVNHPDLLGVRCLLLTTKKSRMTMVFHYTTQDVDEQQLQTFLEKRV
ncbi:hypothetical protein IAD21_00253 [Abditibacteriota bacterium]|nr:hypothetical protein IAD21_00253 [Abditibacteriota bacterium]